MTELSELYFTPNSLNLLSMLILSLTITGYFLFLKPKTPAVWQLSLFFAGMTGFLALVIVVEMTTTIHPWYFHSVSLAFTTMSVALIGIIAFAYQFPHPLPHQARERTIVLILAVGIMCFHIIITFQVYQSNNFYAFLFQMIVILCEWISVVVIFIRRWIYFRRQKQTRSAYALQTFSLSFLPVLISFISALSLNLSPTKRLAHLDKTIFPYTKPRGQNCAMCYVELEVRNREQGVRGEDNLAPTLYALLHVINAACIPPYIKRVNGEVEFYEIGGFALGQGLGAMRGYQQHTLELWPGDMVVLTSDGVVEANNEAGDMLGFEQLEQIVRAGPSTGAEDMLNHLEQAVFAFTGKAEQHDDMTMMVVRV